MSVVSPNIRDKFDSMPQNLQQALLDTGMRLDTLTDLMACLERVIAENEK